jgi:DNA-binding MarR family transcriptional regulator
LLMARLPAALGEQLQRDSGLRLMEYYVLAGLSDQPGHTLRMSNLAGLANSELSRLSHMVQRLERRGLVTREPDPDDKRFTRVVLTGEGLALLEGAAPEHVALVKALIFDVLDEDQQHGLRAAARLVVGHLGNDC